MIVDFDNLLFHPSTKTQLQYIVASQPHAVLISAAAGSGKKTLAKVLAAKLLEIDQSEKLQQYPYFYYVKRAKNKQDITIEQIREAVNALKLKVPGQKKVQRVVFVQDAQFMSVPAQNALLKSLEEPPAGVVFLLSTTSVQNVLPTIASRSQVIKIQPVGLNESLAYWDGQFPTAAIESAWRLSGGSVGLLQALLSQDQTHPLKEAVQLARKFLGAKTYDRLLITDRLSRDKEQLGLFVEALARILSFLHRNALKGQKTKQANALLKSRKELQTFQKALAANTNAKILSLNIVLNLKV